MEEGRKKVLARPRAQRVLYKGETAGRFYGVSVFMDGRGRGRVGRVEGLFKRARARSGKETGKTNKKSGTVGGKTETEAPSGQGPQDYQN